MSGGLRNLAAATAGGSEPSSGPLLSARLSVSYRGQPNVVRDAAFEIGHGEVLGLVGQSGSGKSTIALALLGLLQWKGGRASGEVRFLGRDLLAASERELRRVRGREIGLVLQSPLASLNPALRIGSHFHEAWRAHAPFPRDWIREIMLPLLESVSLPAEEAFLDLYPRQLSVGLAQRVLIALAMLHGPRLLIADEPTSALDVITQSEILQLFGALNRTRGMSILYVSHDLLSVASLCHRVAILHQGDLVEVGPVERIFRNPSHPYTARLIEALPRHVFAPA
jgi:ABC-type dipeptide/oligopeptide/nickel transport system ATPase component